MKKHEWENCNTCWTCKHRKIINGRIFCWLNESPKVLTNKDIMFSKDCNDRLKEVWRD